MRALGRSGILLLLLKKKNVDMMRENSPNVTSIEYVVVSAEAYWRENDCGRKRRARHIFRKRYDLIFRICCWSTTEESETPKIRRVDLQHSPVLPRKPKGVLHTTGGYSAAARR